VATANPHTCELLASHGYYVFTEPSAGRDGLPVCLDAITLDHKVRDMEMALTLRSEYPNADFDRVRTCLIDSLIFSDHVTISLPSKTAHQHDSSIQFGIYDRHKH